MAKTESQSYDIYHNKIYVIISVYHSPWILVPAFATALQVLYIHIDFCITVCVCVIFFYFDKEEEPPSPKPPWRKLRDRIEVIRQLENGSAGKEKEGQFVKGDIGVASV